MIEVDVLQRDIAVLGIHYAVTELERSGCTDNSRAAQRRVAFEACSLFENLGQEQNSFGVLVSRAINRLCSNEDLPQSDVWSSAKGRLEELAASALSGKMPECVLTPVITAVTASVREAYAEVVEINERSRFTCKLRMEIAGSRKNDLHGIGALTSIDGDTRRVRIFLAIDELTPTHMCVFVYILFHELVCHGFQQIAARSGASVAGSPVWSEGWMDGVAWVMAERWVTGYGQSVLGFYPTQSTLGAMRAVHEGRFKGKNFENLGREAFSRLRRILALEDFPDDQVEREGQAERFSIAVNGNEAASPERTRQISRWAAALGAKDMKIVKGPEIRTLIEHFIQNRDLDALLNVLQTYMCS